MKVLASNGVCNRRGIYGLGIALGLAVCLLLVALPPQSLAQEFRATLTGQVTDASGAVITEATVTATNNDTGSVYTDKTSSAGVYYIPYVVPGTYTVKASAPGFKTAIQDNVLLLASKSFGQNFKLQVGEIHETIEVTAAPPMLETANGSGGTIIQAEVMENIPVVDRMVFNTIGLTPGSQNVGCGTRAFDNCNAYIIGGGVNPVNQDNVYNNGAFNQFTVNGANVTQQTAYGSVGAGAWNISPTLDAVQEVNVMADTYDARYGRTTGGTVNVVTKNGTNAFHGELYEAYRDSNLFNANSLTNVYVTGFPTPENNLNQFGGTFGGPIKKDKLWFFFSFEGYRQAQGNVITANEPPAYLRPGYVSSAYPNGNPNVDFGLIAGDIANNNVGGLDPGFLGSNGQQADPYLLNGDPLYQPGDSTNPGNPNNAVCTTGGPAGPGSTCGNAYNEVIFPNLYTGGTGGGALLPAAQFNKTALALLAMDSNCNHCIFPLPNIKGAENYVGGYGEPSNYETVVPNYTVYNQPMIRVDYNYGTKTKLYSFFGMQKGHQYYSTNGLSGLFANGTYNEKASYNAIQDVTYMFSPTLLGDFKLSFSRYENRIQDGILSDAKSPSIIGLNITPAPTTSIPGKQDVPEISIGGLPGNIFGNSNDAEAITNVGLEGDLTWSKGPHNLHLGGGIFEFTYGNPINGTVPNNANGLFSFTGQWTSSEPLCPSSNGNCPNYSTPIGSGWADFLLGLPGGTSDVNWNDSLFDYQPVWNLYAQDDWRITHRLTINLGLRYDVQIGLKERYNELSRGFCRTCVSPITDDGVYQANINNAANIAAWTAAGINPGTLTTVYGTLIPAGVNGQPRNVYNTDWGNIAPRVGFAFALNSRTVFRGGWGYFYSGGLEGGAPLGYQQATNYLYSTNAGADPNQGGVVPLLESSMGPYGLGTPFPATAAYPLGLQPPIGRNGETLASVGSGGMDVDSPLRKIPRTQEVSFGLQHELPSQMALDLHFAGNYASRLRAQQWYNGTLTYSQLLYSIAPGASNFSQPLPNPYYGVDSMSFPGGCGQSPTINRLALVLPWSQYCGTGGSAPPVGEYNDPIGRNWYNAMETKLTKHTTHGLTFNVAYTWSKMMDGSGYVNGYPYQDANELHFISLSDRTHMLSVYGVYDLPVGKGKTFLAAAPRTVDYAIGGWSLGWSFSAQSGTPIGPYVLDQYSCPYAPPMGTSVAHWINPALQDCSSGAPSMGGTGFIYVTTPYYTTAVRSYTVPDLDLSLQKSFKITERVSFSLRGEAFNSLNSVLLGGPDTYPGDPAPYEYYNAATKHHYWSGFSTVGPYQQNNPRNLLVTGKIMF